MEGAGWAVVAAGEGEEGPRSGPPEGLRGPRGSGAAAGYLKWLRRRGLGHVGRATTGHSFAAVSEVVAWVMREVLRESDS